MDLYKTISVVIDSFGIDILEDVSFANILSDYHAFDNNVIKRVMRMLIKHGYLRQLLLIHKENSNDKLIKKEALIDRIIKEEGYRQSYIKYIIESVCYSLGWSSDIPSFDSQDNLDKWEKDIIGNWIFDYRPDCPHTYLSINKKGIAESSSGSRYNWEMSDKNFIKIFLPGLVSYNGTINGLTIDGIAHNEIAGREWEWHAKKHPESLDISNLITGKWMIINDIEGVDNNEVVFLPDGLLSDLYGGGSWTINGENLYIKTGFNQSMTYIARFSQGKLCGTAKNAINTKWSFSINHIIL